MKTLFLENKNICLFFIVLVLILLLIWLATHKGNKYMPIFLKNNVVLASGVNWETNEVVAVNPLNSTEITPCQVNTENLIVSKQLQSYPKNEQNQDISKVKGVTGITKNTCDPKLTPKIVTSHDTTSASLQQAIKLSELPIPGKVEIDGKEIDARYVFTVTALYKGSHCATTYAAGFHRTYCRNHHDYCVWLESVGGRC